MLALARGLVVLMACVASLSLVAQAQSLRLSVRAERAETELGEPVSLVVSLWNAGSTEVRVTQLLEPEFGRLVVQISGPRGDQAGYLPLTLRDSTVGPESLAPGERVEAVVPVFFGGSGWVFQEAGDYEIVAWYQSDPQDARPDAVAAPVMLRVVPGPATLSKLVSGSSASLQAGQFLLWRSGDHLVEGVSLLQEVALASPSTRVAAYFLVARAASRLRPFRDFSRGVVRPADAPGALEQLLRVNDSSLSASALAEKYLSHSSALIATGNLVEARRVAAQASALMSTHPELRALHGKLGQVTRLLELRK
jgi:hypothetical protein